MSECSSGECPCVPQPAGHPFTDRESEALEAASDPLTALAVRRLLDTTGTLSLTITEPPSSATAQSVTWGEVEGDGTSVSVNHQCTTPVVAVRTRNHVEFFDLRALETLAEQLVSARDHVRGLERAARNPETFKAFTGTLQG